MTIQNAIEKATKGGWKGLGEHFTYGEIFFQPTFWQALGKEMGWDKKVVIRRGTVLGNWCAPPNSGLRGECFEEVGFGMDYVDAWLFRWHSFIDALAEGRTAEEWFKNLD